MPNRTDRRFIVVEGRHGLNGFETTDAVHVTIHNTRRRRLAAQHILREDWTDADMDQARAFAAAQRLKADRDHDAAFWQDLKAHLKTREGLIGIASFGALLVALLAVGVVAAAVISH
jgi:hypothetical protein